MRSRIEPMKKVAKTLRNHRELILINYFRAKKAILQRRGRGPEQQGESHHEKMDFEPSESPKSRYIMDLANFPSRNWPTDFY